ncbi:MAG: NADH-quinone oxidoreductase subunit N [Deltaproteobacteria bacterium]|nr:NADH-quinone oxidoreductase subunit N [Deltaproteobacteria bacterium]
MPTSTADSLRWFIPELVLGGGALAVFLLDLFARGARRAQVVTIASLLVLAGSGLALALEPPGASSLFGGLLAHDGPRAYFGALFLCAAALALLVGHGSDALGLRRAGDFAGLVLTLTFGMFVLAEASDLLLLYLGLEAVSLPSYALVGLVRGSRRSSEAALKYLVYGGVASAVLLYGLSLLFGLLGTTHLAGGALQQAATFVSLGGPALRLGYTLALLFILAGLSFKVGAAPFHQWVPDAYEGAPTPVALLLSIGPKLAGFAALLRLLTALRLQGPLAVDWPLILGVLALLTMTLGTLGAFPQTNLKRLLAWSSIAHAGYLLLGLAAANTPGAEALLVYAAAYLLLNAGAFTAVDAIERCAGGDLDQAKGLSKRAPLLAFTFALFLFGLVGLPPFAGFPGKLLLFSSLLERGGAWPVMLALASVLYSAMSLYLYARVLRAMFVDMSTNPAPLELPRVHRALLVLLAGASVALGLWWSPLLRAAAAALG